MLAVRYAQPEFIPDVYFTEGYGRVDARYAGGTWQTISDAHGSWQMPLIITEAGNGFREAVSPYGYTGIYVGDSALPKSRSAWSEIHDLLLEQNVVSLFLRFAPYSRTSIAAAEHFEGLDLTSAGTTYLVNIRETDTMWGALQGRARTAIRKARQHQMTANVRPAIMGDFATTGSFRSLYEETMRRVGAGERYFFDTQYYSDLLHSLGSSLLVAEIRQADRIVSSTLIMRHGDLVHYHLSGSNPDAARLGANTLMIWTVLEWCATNGIGSFHMGGGLSAGDGLDKFKRSFGGDSRDFYTGRYIVNHAAYRNLTAHRANCLGVSKAELEQTGYFPAFRATVK